MGGVRSKSFLYFKIFKLQTTPSFKSFLPICLLDLGLTGYLRTLWHLLWGRGLSCSWHPIHPNTRAPLGSHSPSCHNEGSPSLGLPVDKPNESRLFGFLPNNNQGNKIRPKVVDVFWQHHNNSGRVCDHFTKTIWFQVPTLTTNIFQWFSLHLKKCCVHILLHIFSEIRFLIFVQQFQGIKSSNIWGFQTQTKKR